MLFVRVYVFFCFVLGPTRGIVYVWSPIRETEGEASALPVSNLSSIYIYIAKIDSGSQFESFVNCHAVLFKHLFQYFSNNYIFLS